MKKTIIVSMVVIAISCFLAINSAQAKQWNETYRNETYNVPLNVVNPYNLDVVIGQGKVNIQIISTSSVCNRHNIRYQVTFSGNGRTFLSEDKYVFNGTSSFNANFPAPRLAGRSQPYEASTAGKLDLISRGRSPNLALNFMLHITIDADGKMSALMDDFVVSCRGKSIKTDPDDAIYLANGSTQPLRIQDR
jgi:hypothetical protein